MSSTSDVCQDVIWNSLHLFSAQFPSIDFNAVSLTNQGIVIFRRIINIKFINNNIKFINNNIKLPIDDDCGS